MTLSINSTPSTGRMEVKYELSMTQKGS